MLHKITMSSESNFQFARRIAVNPNSESLNLNSLEIHPQLIKNLQTFGFSSFFPIQFEVCNFFFKNNPKTFLQRSRDICILYPTGSGKTLCYAIPIISDFVVSYNKTAFIIAPSKALCLQIFELFQKLCSGFNIKISLDDCNSKNTECTIYILTPPRLKKLCHNNKISPKSKKFNVNFVVFDEADKLFKQNPDWLLPLENLCGGWETPNIDTWITRRPPQKICTSATLKDDPDFIVDTKLFLPVIFTTNENSKINLPKNLVENICYCEPENKILNFIHICIQFFNSNSGSKILCFVNCCKGLGLLVKILSKNNLFNCTVYNADLPQNQNSKNLGKFLHGKANLLFCTDYLSRGIDMPDVGMVVNYDFPSSFENYVHRVGRTCRGNKNGYAITMVDLDYQENLPKYLDDIRRKSGNSILKYGNYDLEYLKDWYINTVKTTM